MSLYTWYNIILMCVVCVFWDADPKSFINLQMWYGLLHLIGLDHFLNVSVVLKIWKGIFLHQRSLRWLCDLHLFLTILHNSFSSFTHLDMAGNRFFRSPSKELHDLVGYSLERFFVKVKIKLCHIFKMATDNTWSKHNDRQHTSNPHSLTTSLAGLTWSPFRIPYYCKRQLHRCGSFVIMDPKEFVYRPPPQTLTLLHHPSSNVPSHWSY